MSWFGCQILRVEDGRFSNERGHLLFVQSAVRQVAYGTLSRRERKAAHVEVARHLGLGRGRGRRPSTRHRPALPRRGRCGAGGPGCHRADGAGHRAAAPGRRPGGRAGHARRGRQRPRPLPWRGPPRSTRSPTSSSPCRGSCSRRGATRKPSPTRRPRVEAYADSDDVVAKASADCALADALAVGRGEHELALNLVGPQLETLDGRFDVFPLLGRLSLARCARACCWASTTATRPTTRCGWPRGPVSQVWSPTVHQPRFLLLQQRSLRARARAPGVGRAAGPRGTRHQDRSGGSCRTSRRTATRRTPEPPTTWAKDPWPPPA